MIPQLTPAYLISACWPICAIATSSKGKVSRARRARKMATSRAALEDNPTPIGTLEETWMFNGGTSKPRS